MTYVTQTSGTATSGNITLTVPAGVQGGDTMLVSAGLATSGTISMPAGWTLIGSLRTVGTYTCGVWSKIAAGTIGSASSDVASSVVVTMSIGGFKSSAAMIVMRGNNPGALINDQGFASYNPITGGTTTFVGNAVTTTVDNCDIITIFCDKNSTNPHTITVPSGYTSRSSAGFSTGTGASDTQIATKAGGAAGNYGGDTWTITITPGSVGVFTIALAPSVTTQTVFPTSDVANTATGVPTDTSGNRYQNVDDPTLNVTDYIEFDLADEWEGGLSTLSDPGVDTGFVVFYTLGLGATATSITFHVKLLQSTTVIEQWDETVTVDPTDFTHAVLSADAANIVFTSGVASNLRLDFAVTAAS